MYAECGASPATGEHCAPPRKRASAKGEGKAVELPHASGAVELFESALERFRADVTHLPHSYAEVVPEALDGLSGEERMRVYEMLQLEISRDPEGYEVSGAFCSRRPRGRRR